MLDTLVHFPYGACLGVVWYTFKLFIKAWREAPRDAVIQFNVKAYVLRDPEPDNEDEEYTGPWDPHAN